jgi:hypothetical protein
VELEHQVVGRLLGPRDLLEHHAFFHPEVLRAERRVEDQISEHVEAGLEVIGGNAHLK